VTLDSGIAKSLLLAAVVVFVFSTLAASANATWEAIKFHLRYAPTTSRRVIEFPKDFPIGELYIGSDDALPTAHDLVRPAKGTVVIPPGKFVTLIPSHRLYQSPKIIDSILPNAIDRLFIDSCSMDDAEDKYCDNVLARVSHLRDLLVLSLDRSSSTDVGAAHAKDLPHLQYFSSCENGLDGSCIKHFAGLNELRNVNMQGSCLRDKNLQYFAALPHLEHLNIAHCNISDEGLKNLQGCTKLVNLKISDNPKITDKSIPILLSLKSLVSVSIGSTGITAKGAMQLKKLPIKYLEWPILMRTKTDLEAVRKSMRGIFIVTQANRLSTPVNAEVEKMYAPLH